ncbi:hypothetical protein HanHA300_Chr03g0085791 [Helianthus annuus]|nr:hypothetical protein HanHA300_Chr03g0085791 [Helianthus annuus]KAJ0607490.1 hypothetical protein HanHA89_Chr03g0097341 [Helianthus annuus]KAJ0767554.1 hypothetical protein HanLR1_Chr03g0090701 [Helianthus annuus]KAJ0773380.1 hypothetical protein HanOQP8_Chr03g0098611 [Helianthus annuus]
MPGSSSSSLSFREPCFCRHMKKADEIILSIPSDAACNLWGVDMALQIGSSFWTYLLRTSSHFYVIPEVIVPETFSKSIDLISTIMINNNPFHVRIETDGGKFGFTVGIDVIVSLSHLEPSCFLIFTKYFGNDFNLKEFGKNGVEKNFLDVDVDVVRLHFVTYMLFIHLLI